MGEEKGLLHVILIFGVLGMVAIVGLIILFASLNNDFDSNAVGNAYNGLNYQTIKLSCNTECESRTFVVQCNPGQLAYCSCTDQGMKFSTCNEFIPKCECVNQ